MKNIQTINKDNDREVFIYLYYCEKTGMPVYVGKTINIKKRIKQHILEVNKGSKTKFYNWLRKNIDSKPKIIDICNCYNWEEKEIFWINHYRKINSRLKNIMDGGNGFNHLIFDKNYKKLLSESAINKFKKNPKLKENYVEKYRKLNDKDLDDLFFDFHINNISTPKLSIKFKVSQSSITEILNGKSYKHLVRHRIEKYGLPTRVTTVAKNKSIDLICNDYINGYSIDDLLIKYKIHRVTIFRYIKIGTGITYQKHEKLKIRKKVCYLLETTNKTLKQISEILKCDYTLVCKIVSEINKNYAKN